jgi:hypothetical protein
MKKAIPILWRAATSLLIGLALTAVLLYTIEGQLDDSSDREQTELTLLDAALPARLQAGATLSFGSRNISVQTVPLQDLASAAAIASSTGNLPDVFCAPLWQIRKLGHDGMLRPIPLSAEVRDALGDELLDLVCAGGVCYGWPAFTSEIALYVTPDALAKLPPLMRALVSERDKIEIKDLVTLVEFHAATRNGTGIGLDISSNPHLLAMILNAAEIPESRLLRVLLPKAVMNAGTAGGTRLASLSFLPPAGGGTWKKVVLSKDSRFLSELFGYASFAGSASSSQDIMAVIEALAAPEQFDVPLSPVSSLKAARDMAGLKVLRDFHQYHMSWICSTWLLTGHEPPVDAWAEACGKGPHGSQ